MSEQKYTEVTLLSVILDGEDNFWLCEPKGSKALAKDWKAVDAYWAYPVNEDVSRFSSCKGFESTDGVYELDNTAVSKVLQTATLASDVKGKKERVGRSTFIFVPAAEVKRMDDYYRRYKKVKADMAVEEQTEDDEAERRASVRPAVEQSAEGRRGRPEVDAQPVPATRSTTARLKAEIATEEEDLPLRPTSYKRPRDSNDDDRSLAEQFGIVPVPRANPPRNSDFGDGNSHKRKTPYSGSQIYTAPVSTKPMGAHRSSEAFEWERLFIVHRGSMDFLCPLETENTYAFRLDRVTHNGIPVFLLFGSNICNSEPMNPSAHGVPVYEKVIMSAEGGEGGRNQVLVVTRLASKQRKFTPGRSTRPRRRSGDSSSDFSEDDYEEYDDEDSNEDDDDDSNDFFQPRVPSVARTPKPPPRPAKKEVPSRKKVEPLKETGTLPLQTVGVNFWTEPQREVPSAVRLAEKFGFSTDAGDVPKTVVFPDGVCVTYTAATAAAVKPSQSGKITVAAASSGAPVAGDEEDLGALNEHILSALAQLNNQ